MASHTFKLPPSLLDHPPLYELPYGPIWQYRAHELVQDYPITEARFIVRRLTMAPNLLIAGALLRHVSQLEHPRLYSPNYWAQDGSGLWLATLRPLGVPLSWADLRELTWNEAVSLWRPLAEAVQKAHQRGIVHGQISPWTVWYNSDAEQLTAIDVGCWLGDRVDHADCALWLSQELLTEPLKRLPNTLSDVYGLARLLMYLIDPQQAQQPRPELGAVPPFAMAHMERALSPEAAHRPPRLEELIAATSPTQLERYDARLRDPAQEQIISVLSARVSNREYYHHPRLGRGLKFHLNLPPDQDHEQDQIGAFFYHDIDASLYHSVRWAWEGAQLNLLDARVVTNSAGQRFVTSHDETLPVLEPTFPIAVSNVLKAERCTSRFLVDERDGGSSSSALVLGNLVHGLLDDLSQDPPLPFEQSLPKNIALLRLDMLAAGMSDDDMERLARDARQHYDNLARFTSRHAASAAQGAQGAQGAAQTPARDALRAAMLKAQPQEKSWSGHHIEVTRYSPLYGLEGRIDLATEDDHEGLQIIELKSGAAWDGHLSQVRCYTLLWDSLAKQRQLPMSGYLLYSRYGRLTPVPMHDISRERRILRARNELVACHRAFIDPTYRYTPPHYMKEPRSCEAPACKFRRDRCHEQTDVLGLDPAKTPDEAAALGGPWQGHDVELVARAWAYWRHFNRLIEMERWAQNASLGVIFQPGRLGQRLQNHQAVTGMTLSHIDLAQRTITFEGRGAQLFMAGASLLAHRGDLNNAHILQGEVVESGPEHVVVKSLGAPIAQTLDPQDWILDSLPARLGVRQSIRALYDTIRRRDPVKLRVLLDTTHPDVRLGFEAQGTFSPTPPALMVDVPIASIGNAGPRLNDVQRRALHLAIHAPTGALIQGPPGTGKTTVIAQLVRELVMRGQRVLVSAQTNTAVDTILSKIIDAGVRTFLRVGSVARSRELAHKLTQAGADPKLYFTQDIAQEIPTLEALATALRTCPVYASTTHSAVNSPAFQALSAAYGDEIFDVVIVDEASQLTEPMTLGAIHRAKRFILVGDHRQLPPIVQSEQALSAYLDPSLPLPEDVRERHVDILTPPSQQPLDPGPVALDAPSRLPGLASGQPQAPPQDSPQDSPEDEDHHVARPRAFEVDAGLRAVGVAGLDRSLFERLIQHLPHVMLEEQYRMHADIMAFSNQAYYHGKLRAHEAVGARALSPAPQALLSAPAMARALLDPSKAVVFAHVLGHDAGRSNRQEAAAILQTLRALLDPALWPGGQRPSVGVISPFRAQVQLLRSMTRWALAELADEVDIDTVERFQGGERDVILVSLVKTERAGDFLSDARRLNVTLTRARKKLILFGHQHALQLNPTFRQLIEQPQTHVIPWQDASDAAYDDDARAKAAP